MSELPRISPILPTPPTRPIQPAREANRDPKKPRRSPVRDKDEEHRSADPNPDLEDDPLCGGIDIKV